MDNYDKLLLNLMKKSSKKGGENSNADKICLSEELFASYFDNLLNESDKEKLEDHLSECQVCRKHSIILHNVKIGVNNEQLMKAPQKSTLKAKQLISKPLINDVIEIIVKFTKDSIEVIKDTVLMAQPIYESSTAVSRVSESMDEISSSNTISLSKRFDDLQIDIVIEKLSETTCEIEVKTTNAESALLLNNIRLNLLHNDREIASYLTKKGRVFFKNIDLGSYNLLIIKEKEIAGEIFLKLES